MLTSLFSLFYVTGEFHRFLHRGRAQILIDFDQPGAVLGDSVCRLTLKEIT